MPNINKQIWVSVGVRYNLWLLLRDRAFKNNIEHPKTSVQGELETILVNALKVKEKDKGESE